MTPKEAFYEAFAYCSCIIAMGIPFAVLALFVSITSEPGWRKYLVLIIGIFLIFAVILPVGISLFCYFLSN